LTVAEVAIIYHYQCSVRT